MTSPPRHFSRQVLKVARVLLSADKWWTLDQLAAEVCAPTQSVSARLRDLRKERWGNQEVVRIPKPHGSHLYRLATRAQLKERLKEVRP